MKMAFLQFLLNHFSLGYQYDMCASVQTESAEYQKDNDGVMQFIEEHIEASKDSFFTLKEAKEVYGRKEYGKGRVGTLKTDLEKSLGACCLEQKMIKGKNYKNVFLGYKVVDGDDMECMF